MNINGHKDLMMLQACRFLYEHTGHGSEYLREIMLQYVQIMHVHNSCGR